MLSHRFAKTWLRLVLLPCPACLQAVAVGGRGEIQAFEDLAEALLDVGDDVDERLDGGFGARLRTAGVSILPHAAGLTVGVDSCRQGYEVRLSLISP